uniref:Uncharacterized protein n=1 Tax=Helianthus annuus TaxID=4232 RepID=A0A251VPF7_HELAN
MQSLASCVMFKHFNVFMMAQAIDVMYWFIPHKETGHMVLKNTCSFKIITCLFMLVCNQIGYFTVFKDGRSHKVILQAV